jgi:hypothetical protein
MKLSKPFGMNGYLKIEAVQKVGAKSSALSPDSSGKAEVTVPVAWKPNAPFEIQVAVSVSYELFDVGAQDFFDTSFHVGSGAFGAVAEWRANLSEDGLELQSAGSGPHGSTKSDGDITVAAASALISQSFAKEKRPFVKWKLILLAGRQSKGIGVGFGPVSADAGGSSSKGKTFLLELIVNFDVEESPPPPKEEKKAIKVLKLKIGPYEHAKIKTDGVKKSSIPGYSTWAEFRSAIMKLPKATHEEWKSGDPQHLRPRTIKVTGFADTSGPMSENDKKYGMGRAKDVQEWIQLWTGAADTFFVVKSEGEGKGGTDKKADEKKMAQNRYVELELSYIE